MTTETRSITDTITSFLESIGIPVVFDTISENTFLPGILISGGSLTVDREKLLYPGDLLHEAGHIAVATPEDRMQVYGDIGANTGKDRSDGEETMAIAWSYAASVHLNIDPAIVFHSDGYKGYSSWYIQEYTSGRFPYLPLLQWAGFCYDRNNAIKNGAEPYPKMIKWLR